MKEKTHPDLLLYILLIAIIMGCNGKNEGENTVNDHKYEKDAITLQQAIEIGKGALKDAGYEHWNEELAIEADENNTVWKEHIRINSGAGFDDTDIKRFKLKEKRYWAIHYGRQSIPGVSNETRRGGDAWVFIDRSTGKVIGVLLGQ